MCAQKKNNILELTNRTLNKYYNSKNKNEQLSITLTRILNLTNNYYNNILTKKH